MLEYKLIYMVHLGRSATIFFPHKCGAFPHHKVAYKVSQITAFFLAYDDNHCLAYWIHCYLRCVYSWCDPPIGRVHITTYCTYVMYGQRAESPNKMQFQYITHHWPATLAPDIVRPGCAPLTGGLPQWKLIQWWWVYKPPITANTIIHFNCHWSTS